MSWTGCCPRSKRAWCRRWRRACERCGAGCRPRTWSTAGCRTRSCWKSSPRRGSARWWSHEQPSGARPRICGCSRKQSSVMSGSLVERFEASVMNTYGPPSLALVRGSGAVVVDEAGKSYVDFLGGIAVNLLGHAHPAVVAAVSAQIATLGHVSNLFAAPTPVALAERLLALAGRPGAVFFANSGAEANEAAFKLSRRTGRTKVVAAEASFHGRTMGALALTGQPAKADPFRQLPGSVTHVT